MIFLDNWINSSSLFWTQVVTWHERYRKFSYKCEHDFLIDISRVPPMLSWRKVDIKDHLDSVIILLETQRVENTFCPQQHLLHTNIPVRLAREVIGPNNFQVASSYSICHSWLHATGRKSMKNHRQIIHIVPPIVRC